MKSAGKTKVIITAFLFENCWCHNSEFVLKILSKFQEQAGQWAELLHRNAAYR